METTTPVHLHVLIGDRMCVACAPNEVKVGPSMPSTNRQMSGDPRAVTCVACRRTEVFKTALDKLPK